MTVLITGAASGIGAAVAELMLSKGHTVVGVDVAEMKERERLISFVADITDAGAIGELALMLEGQGVTLDAIICAAGIHRMASLVEGELSEMRRVVDVNLLGAMTVNRIMFPRLKEKGRIVIITSEVAPLAPLAFNGLYSLSKTALDCYAQALRQEVGLLGVKVVTVRPGAVETPLCSSSLVATERLAEQTVLYKEQAGHFLSLVKRFMGKPISPNKFAPTVYRAATARHPRLVYAKNRNIGLALLSALPKRAQCGIIKLLLNRKRHEMQ